MEVLLSPLFVVNLFIETFSIEDNMCGIIAEALKIQINDDS